MLSHRVALLALVLGVLPACGGGGDEDSGTSTDMATGDSATGTDTATGTDAAGTDAVVPPVTGFEGYGAAATGGHLSAPGGFTEYHVTSLGDSGPGTLREALSAGDRLVVFDVAGEITLLSDIPVRVAYVTVDGSTAPAPGITIRKASPTDGEVRLGGNNTTGVAHDLIFTHLRFIGSWDGTENGLNNAATIVMDGEDHVDGIHNIILDHLSLENATDSSPDIWGYGHDITVSWCIIRESMHPTTISHSGDTMVRERISFHHNVYAYNHERNPQIRGAVTDFDYVNNVVFNWQRFGGGYGVRLREINGTYPSGLNFVNNFFSSVNVPEAALVYGDTPGMDDDGPMPGPDMYPGGVWVMGNVFPAANVDGYSTLTAPVPVPAAAAVTTWAVDELDIMMLPSVGMMYRNAAEQTLIDEIAAAMP